MALMVVMKCRDGNVVIRRMKSSYIFRFCDQEHEYNKETQCSNKL